jgi:hypothetical protein
MPDLIGVSHDVSEAARELANASGRVMYQAVRDGGCVSVALADAYLREHNAPIMAAGAYLAEVVRCDITEAVEAERKRCRMAEYSEDVRAARQACAETRAILEPTVWKLADAQDVHRLASDAYRRAFDGLETALQLADAETGG